MSFKKQYLKSKPVCKVSFKLDKEVVGDADSVQILGDFNSWDKGAEGMKKLKSGGFSAVLELPLDEELQCRYLVNGTEWVNDPEADGVVTNEFGEENFIISTKG